MEVKKEEKNEDDEVQGARCEESDWGLDSNMFDSSSAFNEESPSIHSVETFTTPKAVKIRERLAKHQKVS